MERAAECDEAAERERSLMMIRLSLLVGARTSQTTGTIKNAVNTSRMRLR